uniref:UDP-3-O-acyl-N-acetylglucosamine deacetylase n=1 Tax=candidate division WOR-3 bacterium TaxID=2052148 RepID=A0A7C6EAL7_UNCW3
MKQKTIKEPVGYKGMGILFGKESKMSLSPAPPNTGIIFNEKVCATRKNSFIYKHSLGLQEGRTKIYFTEHFLATCFGLGISNLFITVSGKELPFGDGSALPFLKLLLRAGIECQEAERKIYNLSLPVLVLDRKPCPWTVNGRRITDNGFILAVPAKTLAIDCLIDLQGHFVQFWGKKINPINFRKELSKARTFGFYPNPAFLKRILTFKLKRVEGKPRSGDAKGGLPLISPGFKKKSFRGFKGALPLCVHGLILPKLFRAQNEMAGHKVLDLLGSLALLNYSLNAKLFAFKPNHKLNQEFINHLG